MFTEGVKALEVEITGRVHGGASAGGVQIRCIFKGRRAGILRISWSNDGTILMIDCGRDRDA